MSLFTIINQELREAMKGKNVPKTAVLRFILAGLHNKSIEKRGAGEDEDLNDEEVIQALQKEVKKRKEAIELFEKSGRGDLVEKELHELKFFEKYLPAELSREEVLKVVDKVIMSGANDFGTVMKEVMKELKGQADGRVVSEAVKERISGK